MTARVGRLVSVLLMVEGCETALRCRAEHSARTATLVAVVAAMLPIHTRTMTERGNRGPWRKLCHTTSVAMPAVLAATILHRISVPANRQSRLKSRSHRNAGRYAPIATGSQLRAGAKYVLYTAAYGCPSNRIPNASAIDNNSVAASAHARAMVIRCARAIPNTNRHDDFIGCRPDNRLMHDPGQAAALSSSCSSSRRPDQVVWTQLSGEPTWCSILRSSSLCSP